MFLEDPLAEVEVLTQPSSPVHSEDSLHESAVVRIDVEDSVSRELLQREKELLKRERELQTRAQASLQRTKDRVDEGLKLLENPLLKPNAVKSNSESQLSIKKVTQPLPRVSHSAKTHSGAGPAATKDVEGGDELVTIPEGLSSEAAIRFLKAKLQVVQQELDKSLSSQALAEATHAFQEQKIANLEAKHSKASKAQEAAQAQLQALKQGCQEYKLKFEQSESQLTQLKKEIVQAAKAKRQLEMETQSHTLRLDRAVEESERAKANLSKLQQESKENAESLRKSNESLLAQNKRLERQKADLIAAFKKQMQLIEVLKKQKLHLEASKALQIKEEEFLKTLNIDSK